MGIGELKTKGKVLRCPNCGASDAVFDIDAGGLRCEHCREVFASPKINQFGGMDELVGEIREGGAADLRNDDFVVTFRCPSCGANVMMDKEATDTKCHWCGHNLKTAEKIPNGAMPDLILPFSMKRDAAYRTMKNFAKDKRLLSNGKFWRRLKEENIKGVYLPYIVVDVRTKVKANGHVGVPGNPVGIKAELGLDSVEMLKIRREFEMHIDDLTIEASRDKLNQDLLVNTNHIINAIMPFDTEEAVAWDPRYLKGYTCEKRDVNVENVKMRLDSQICDIVREQISNIALEYGQLTGTGIEEIKYLGRKWRTAYLPVWIYSCPGMRMGKGRILHYIAVNARTGEIMGSVPIKQWTWKIIGHLPVMIMGVLLFLVVARVLKMTEDQMEVMIISLLLIQMALMYVINGRADEYTNIDARHEYETDTHVEVKKIKKLDEMAEDGFVPRLYKTKIIDENGKEREYISVPVANKDEFRKKVFFDFSEPERIITRLAVMIIVITFLALIVATR